MASRSSARASEDEQRVSISEAARAMGSVRSDAKRAAARRRWEENPESRLPPRVKEANPMQRECTCGIGPNLELLHPTTCPRGRSQRRVIAKVERERATSIS